MENVKLNLIGVIGRRFVIAWTFVLMAVMAPSSWARVGVLDLGDRYYDITPTIETPHIRWAKPLAGGPIKLLVIAPFGAQRETVELWQRLELDYTAIGVLGGASLGAPVSPDVAAGSAAPEVEKRLRAAAGKTFDVAIVSGIKWKALPADVVRNLLERVHAGMGLILVRPEDKPEGAFKALMEALQSEPRPEWVAAGSRLDELPNYRPGKGDTSPLPDKVFDCFRYGQGRVLKVKVGGSARTYLTPDVGGCPDATFLDFDDQQAFAAKLIAWAARRDPAVFARGIAFLPESATVEVDAAGRTAISGALTCRLTLRDRWNNVLTTRTQAVAFAADRIRVSIPVGELKGGRHRAEIQFLDEKGGILSWGVWTFPVTPAFGIGSVELKTEEVRPDRPIVEGTVTFRGQPPSRAAMEFSVRDSYGRIVARETRNARAGAFRMELLPPLAVYHELAVRLRLGDRILDETRARLAVSLKGPGWDDYSFLMWHMSSEGAMERLVSRELTRKYGVDTFYCGGSEDSLWRMAKDGAWPVPYMTRFTNKGRGNHRAPCLSDTNYMQNLSRTLYDAGHALRKFRPAAYSLGNEPSLGYGQDVCLCPLCAESFRAWLKARYPNLDALNDEWGSAFTNWNDVTGMVRAEALAGNQVPRWVDHRMHMSAVFMGAFRRCDDAIRQADPEARTGYDGIMDDPVYGGHDYWESSKFMRFWGCYPYGSGRQGQMAAGSFFPRTSYAGIWCGGYPDIRWDFHARAWPWEAVGVFNSIWWFCSHGAAPAASQHDALAPDFRPYWDFEIFAGEVRRLKAGLGKLLQHAEADSDPMRIYYAQDALMVNAAYGLPIADQNVAAVIAEAGYGGAPWISPEQVIREQWNNCRALFLPGIQALPDAAAESIKRFVGNGGLLVATIRPGVTDEHGRIRKDGGILDEVFGVRQDTSRVGEPALKDLLSVTDGPLGSAKDIVIDPAARVDPEARDVTYGKASNGLPYFIAHRYGRGVALLFNTTTRKGIGLGAALKPYLVKSGVVPPQTLLTAYAGKPPGAITPYRNGQAQYYIIDAYSTEMQLHVPAPAHWYLGETDQYLGFESNPRIRLPAARYNRVLAGLPYRVEALTIKSAGFRWPRAKSRVKKFRLTVQAMNQTPAGYHVIRVTVKGPDGKERPCYAANVGAPKGRGEYRLPLAYDEPAGEWTVHARDVATGVAAEIAFDNR